MTIKEAIEKIHAPKGITSVIAGVMSGDYSVFPHQKGIEADRKKAEEMVEGLKESLKNCTSDWSYWSILGDLEYWRAVLNILVAGEIGGGIVADVEFDDSGGVVMDQISKVTEFGEKVLKETKKMTENGEQETSE